MTGIIKKINSLTDNRTTYKVGLLQAKAFKVLKGHTSEGLKEFEISTLEWALLGLLYDESLGMRPSVLAGELGVEASFITTLFSRLNKRGLVDARSEKADSRVKIIYMTTDGKAFVRKVEKSVRSHMKVLIKDVSIGDIASYISVLQQLIINSNYYERNN